MTFTHTQTEELNPSEIPASIKSAYKYSDGLASKMLHKKKQKKQQNTDSDSDHIGSVVLQLECAENHKSMGDYVKSIIYGGLDGIVTTFAVVNDIFIINVAGVQGANLTAELILVLGIANLIADAISMGIGDYLSEKAELQYCASEYAREKWEFENFPEGEIQEMIDIYVEKGVEPKDAELILRKMALYPDFFLEHMMIQELEMSAPTGDENPAKGGMVTFVAFICFGIIPLLSYVVFETVEFQSFNPKFLISIILTLFTLFLLGAVKAKITETNIFKSGFFVMLNGATAAASSYAIGLGLSKLVHLS